MKLKSVGVATLLADEMLRLGQRGWQRVKPLVWRAEAPCRHALEKEMATHSSVLAWRIPGTGEPGGLLSLGSHSVRHD